MAALEQLTDALRIMGGERMIFETLMVRVGCCKHG